MANIKHLIHKECAKHDIPSVFVESIIARIIVARAMYYQTRFEPTWRVLVGWHRLWRWDQRLIDTAIEMITDTALDHVKVSAYVREYIRVHDQVSKRA